jgi:hypothetical protein
MTIIERLKAWLRSDGTLYQVAIAAGGEKVIAGNMRRRDYLRLLRQWQRHDERAVIRIVIDGKDTIMALALSEVESAIASPVQTEVKHE